jgi:hypothetical protein
MDCQMLHKPHSQLSANLHPSDPGVKRPCILVAFQFLTQSDSEFSGGTLDSLGDNGESMASVPRQCPNISFERPVQFSLIYPPKYHEVTRDKIWVPLLMPILRRVDEVCIIRALGTCQAKYGIGNLFRRQTKTIHTHIHTCTHTYKWRSR